MLQSRSFAGRCLAAIACALPLVAAPAQAQRPEPPADSVRRDSAAVRLTPITVTATRSETDVFRTPMPVSVLDPTAIREQAPNTVSDLFRGLPGLDVTGVGANQVRPMIRGQRGQRILLLADGLRLNNTRRQSSFGELPALIDVANVERVEIVRGPSSVLYGSDAIGGVVNVITTRPQFPGLQGSLSYRYSTHDDQQNVHGSIGGRVGAFTLSASGAFRSANPYGAPAGTFGDITLADDAKVNDSGVDDYSLEGLLGYRLARGHDVFVKVERYSADSAGFGYVDPALYAPGEPAIEIRYPYQRFNKVSFGYRGLTLDLPVADKLDVTGYYQDNTRRLTLDVFIPFGSPTQGLAIDQRNFTDIETVGGRVEARKYVGGNVALTYGLDVFRDRTTNTDTNLTTMIGFGPPSTDSSLTPLTPNASFRSLGVFLQSEFRAGNRATFILGGRYQDVAAATRVTPGFTGALVEANDRTVVGAANAIVEVARNVSVVGSVGRAFRSPNLIERFFDGPTPEGFGYQSPNPDLKAETSLNVDLGLRYRNRWLYAEGFVFQNTISNGIRIQATGDTVAGLPEFRDVNVEKLRARGLELSADARLPHGLAIGGNFTHLDTKNVTEDQNSPIGDGFSNQLVGFVRYAFADRFWAEYRVRHNFEREDPEFLPGNPIGTTLPAFTTMAVRAGATVLRTGAMAHRVGLAVTNLTNALYSEFSNAGFFRPEPKRSLVVTYDVTF